MKKGWLDNYGKVENANDSNVSFSENFVGLGNNTKGRKFSPAWGGQFKNGGFTPMSPREQIAGSINQYKAQPTIPYKQTKDPAEFYKSWIQNSEYKKRLLQSGYVDTNQKTNLIKGDIFEGAGHAISNRLKSLNSLQSIEYSTQHPSDARPSAYGKSTIMINPHDYADTSEDTVKAHEMAHIGGAAVADGGGGLQMSDFEKDLLTKSLLPNTRPTISGVQGSEENKISYRNLEDWEHLKSPQEIKADLDALRYKMYDTGIYDITKGQKFTESDFEKFKKSFSKDRVFKRLENRIGKDNFINLMNVIAQNNDENLTPIANNGASLPGATGMMYARTAGSAPSEGKYAKKTLPSAQTGANIDTVSTTDPRYAELYRNRQVGSWSPQYNAYNLPDLPEFTVIGEDERVKEAMSQTNQRFAEGVLNTMSAPQYAMMEMLTGKQQAPSDAWGFQNTGGWLDSPTSFGKNLSNFGMDAVLDPMNLVGAGIADDIAKTILKRLPKKGSPKQLASSVDDVGKGFKSEIDWSKWNPDTPKYPELMNEYNAIEESTKKAGTWMKNPDGSEFQGTPEQFVQQNSENFKKAFPNVLKDKSGNIQKTYHGSQDTFESFDPGIMRVGRTRGQGIYTSPVKEKAASYATKGDKKLYEFYQNANKRQTILEDFNALSDERFDKFLKENPKGSKDFDKKLESFMKEENRIFDRDLNDNAFILNEGYDFYKAAPDEYVVPFTNYPKSAVGNVGFFDMTNPNIYKGLIPSGIATGLSLEQKKDGGIIKDNQGYWNPDNWGKPVEINSNNITMKGVYEPLLGVSNTGDARIMEPGKNYKFKGNKVIEFPIRKANNGIKINDEEVEIPRDKYVTKMKEYNNFLKLNNYTTPYYKDNNIDTSDGGMNCINGVCYMVSNLTGVKFDKAQTKDTYTGNATFADNAMNEGYYRSNPEKEGFGVGDIFQYSRKKGSSLSRFPGDVNFKNENDLYPNHAVLIVDEYDKDGTKYFKIANNSGKDKVELQDVSESELMNRYKKGYKTFDGGITYRYDPDKVASIKKENEERIKLLKGNNPYSDEYSKFDPSNLNFLNNKIQGLNVTNELTVDKSLQKYADVYKTVYNDLGKGANMPLESFNKLILNQVGIAGQETKFGEIASNSKDLVPDSVLPYARRAREIIGTKDNWKQDYWESNADNVQKEFNSYEDFVKSFESEDSDYNPYRTPRSIGVFQQKDLSERGKFYNYDLDSFEGQVKSSLALAVDNYHKLKNKYPNLSEDEIIKLTTLMHNAPGKAIEPRFVNYYLKRDDVDYINKVDNFKPKSFTNTKPVSKNTKEVKFEKISPEKAKSISDYVTTLPKQKRNGGSVGINQLDAQPMKKLNQLTNFTNNPDKTNWLDKYN